VPVSLHLTGLFSYPIKSCGAVPHKTAVPDPFGLPWDRRWMLVDEAGAFVSQRILPSLARIQPLVTPLNLRVTSPENPQDLSVPLAPISRILRTVRVWEDTVAAWDEGDSVAAWFTQTTGRPLRLVRFPDQAHRPVNPRYAATPSQTAFADGFPMLLASEESLADLNRRLEQRGRSPVPMSRFRPNLVVAGTGLPYAEDDWLSIRCGGQQIDIVKPCSRCSMTTIDQQTAQIPDRSEPLATLSEYRRWEGKVVFAQNATVHGLGALTIGTPLEILHQGEKNRWRIGSESDFRQ